MPELYIPTKEEFTEIVRREIQSAFAAYFTNQNTPSDQWFSLDELCAYLPGNPKKATIYGKVSNREIPHSKDGKRLAFLKSDIDKWLKEKGRKTISDVQAGASDSLKGFKKTSSKK